MPNAAVPPHPVLMVDDEPRALTSLGNVLRFGGIASVRACDDSRQVLSLMEAHPFSAVLLDLSMPHLSGQALLPRIIEAHPGTPVIVITGANDIETAVSCMQAGAFDYLVKPIEDQRLLSSLQRARDLVQLRHDYVQLKERVFSGHLEKPDVFAGIVTASHAMHMLFRYIEAISGSDRPALITGETGVGKELIARALHAHSERPGPIISVNVAGLDDTLFSDTLFGHVRGAYTGAEVIRRGLVAEAENGTLLLDEIGDLAASSQVKLLRLLQEGEYFPGGADMPKRGNARFLLTTNRDLDGLVRQKQFRKDLYFRLQTHRLHVPPLRERPEDIPLLLDHFLQGAADGLGKKKPAYPKELPALLSTYSFPGNIRELEAMVYEAVSLHSSRILSMTSFRDHVSGHREALRLLPSTASVPKGPPVLPLEPFPTLRAASDAVVDAALERAGGNMNLAAQLLGITPSGLSKRMKRRRDQAPCD